MKTVRYQFFKKSASFLFAFSLILMLFYCNCITSVGVYADTDDKKVTNNKRIVVSMGDSYSAGEGIEKFYHQDDFFYNRVNEQDWLGHRSEECWAGRLTLNGISGSLSKHKFEYSEQNYDDANWYFVASSGALTSHIDNKQEKKCRREDVPYFGTHDINSQIDIIKTLKSRGEEIDYITLTIGGNDANFGGIVSDAANAVGGFFNPGGLNDKLQDIWYSFYNDTDDDISIRDRIKNAYKRIQEEAGDTTKIIVAGYPKLFKDGATVIRPTKITVIRSSEITLINDSVTRFNKEIRAIVNSCKAENMRIAFVSVEEEFAGHEAYSDEAWINSIEFYHTLRLPTGHLRLLDHFQELDILKIIPSSSYSMHPNKKGAEAYARCVQAKIDSIEADGGKSEWPDMGGSDERDIVLVLDTSGSMDGKPIEETVKASEKFVKTVLKLDASIGVVSFDSSSLRICDFCQNESYLINTFNKLNAYGGTNTESGLREAEEMLKGSNARKKIIVLMSDGEPNVGKVGEDLIEYAKSIRDKGIYIYTLGFFSSLGSEKSYAQDLMKRIAGDDLYYFDIDDAENIVYFFGDIADQIQGQKYIYIKIACPVDVTVEYNGETLSSKNSKLNTRTSFGALTFEENTEDAEENVENREGEPDTIKILRLKNGVDYDISINGTGRGRMNYTIGFMDDNGEYSDMRTFKNIKITKDTLIDTIAAVSDKTVLNVDEDGDGKYDLVYEAGRNGKGKLVEKPKALYIALGVSGVLIIICICGLVFVSKRRKKHKSV